MKILCKNSCVFENKHFSSNNTVGTPNNLVATTKASNLNINRYESNPTLKYISPASLCQLISNAKSIEKITQLIN